jgi:dUTP pyrophosphatase
VRRLREDAVLPTRAYVGDAGFDLSACDRVELGPGQRALVPTGIAVAIPSGCAGFVLPRSGLALNHGVTCLNTPGLIDPLYRGELKVLLVNTDPSRAYDIERGDRIAQLVLLSVEMIEWVEVDDLGTTERNTFGFGSTGS